MSAVLYTPHFVQFFDANGLPLNGGKLYTYTAGTTTPKATYTAADGLTPNANPIILDSSGRAVLFLSGSYKFTLKDSLDNLIKETDNITAFSTQSSTVDNIVANFTEDVIQTGDSVIFSDLSDGGTTKRDTVQGILDLVPAQEIRDTAYSEVSSVLTFTTVIPNDDTIPTSTEGDTVTGLTAAITPKTTTNKLRVTLSLYLSSSATSSTMTASIFVNGGSAAAAVGVEEGANNGIISNLRIVYEYTPASTSAQTITVRCGPAAASTLTLNGTAGARKYGGVMKSSLILEEITA